jgi:hypothetical protein
MSKEQQWDCTTFSQTGKVNTSVVPNRQGYLFWRIRNLVLGNLLHVRSVDTPHLPVREIRPFIKHKLPRVQVLLTVDVLVDVELG